MLRPGVPQEQGTDSSHKMTTLRCWSTTGTGHRQFTQNDDVEAWSTTGTGHRQFTQNDDVEALESTGTGHRQFTQNDDVEVWSPQEQGTDSSHKMTMLRPGVPQEQGTDSSHKMTMLRPGEEPDPKSRVKVEVAVLGSPSLISLMVSVDVVQHTKEQAGEAQDKRADS